MRSEDLLPRINSTILIALFVIAGLVALAGVEYAIIHRLIPKHTGTGSWILLIIVTALFLAVFIAPFLAFMFAAIYIGFLPFVNDRILEPWYRRRYIREFQEHISHKPLQGKLKKWRESLGAWSRYVGGIRWSSLGSTAFNRHLKQGLNLEHVEMSSIVDACEEV
jgi:hypothetical protein